MYPVFISLVLQLNAFGGPKPFYGLGGAISLGVPVTPLDTMFS